GELRFAPTHRHRKCRSRQQSRLLLPEDPEGKQSAEKALSNSSVLISSEAQTSGPPCHRSAGLPGPHRRGRSSPSGLEVTQLISFHTPTKRSRIEAPLGGCVVEESADA